MTKVSILIPVFNEEKNLPALFSALRAQKEAEIIFVDNASTDGSAALLKKFAAGRKGTKWLREKEHGFAPPLNRALREAKGEFLLFLDADARPARDWTQQMLLALAEADIAVGETKSAISGKITAYGRTSLLLFKDHSHRAAHAHGHALPWGPTCNLGVRAAFARKVGPFSPAAGGAFDIDWCWRAVLLGGRITFAPRAKVTHLRRNEREALLRQFDRYGLGEAWLHRTYSFLLDPEDRASDPLRASLDAFRRILERDKHSPEVAAAFASGVRAGYERPYQPCPQKRALPKAAVAWPSCQNEITVFVPGKGITQFSGKMLEAWRAHQETKEERGLALRFQKLFDISAEEAAHEAHEFRKALRP